MQTKEIIKVLSAFSKKEAIEFKEKNVDSSQWKQFDYSQKIDFDKFDYRIKNDKLPIFQKGDIIISENTLKNNMTNSFCCIEIKCIEKKDNDFIYFDSNDNIIQNIESYINVYNDTLLWYWEYYYDGKWNFINFRSNYKNICIFIKNQLKINVSSISINPIYNLGHQQM